MNHPNNTSTDSQLRRTKYANPLEALYANIVIDNNGCWVWQRSLSRGGYGRMVMFSQLWLTHRASLLLHGEDMIEGLECDHLCRNRKCCNPEHLEQVNRKVNIERSTVAEVNRIRNTRDICFRGHNFDEKNTYWGKGKSGNLLKRCRICAARAEALRRQKREKKEPTTKAQLAYQANALLGKEPKRNNLGRFA